MNVPVFLTVTAWGALTLPVGVGANVSDAVLAPTLLDVMLTDGVAVPSSALVAFVADAAV